MVNNPDGTPLAAFQSITASPGQKSPRSTVPFNKSNGNARGFLNSQQSIDSDGTIAAFLTRDRDGLLSSTQKMIDRQQDRVEKVKRAREKALQNELEKSAKLILKERRYESNVKRHQKMMVQDSEYRADQFGEI